METTAEEDIRRLMGRYIQAHDTHDVDGVVAVFAEDGVFAAGSGEWKGRARVREFFDSSRARAAESGSRGKLMCANSIISVRGDTAEALTDVVGYGAEREGSWQLRLVAQYRDKFVRREGEWLYAEKQVVLL
ncbi:MAG: nuclear transport factor 2 family protein [Chloroflexi bacterium]|nr:nuclear transport factor 2 family protein [Chloroflexota bacterium]